MTHGKTDLFQYSSAEMPADEEDPVSAPSLQPSPSVPAGEKRASLPIVPEVVFDRPATSLELETEEEEQGQRRVFRLFTRESYKKLIKRDLDRKEKQRREPKGDEGKLVDGEIVFNEVEDNLLRVKPDPKLVDGQPLPEKLGRMPREMEGVALEEIDPNIMEKVCKPMYAYICYIYVDSLIRMYKY